MIFDFVWKIKSVLCAIGKSFLKTLHSWFGEIHTKPLNVSVGTAMTEDIQTTETPQIPMVTNETIAIPEPVIIPAETQGQPPKHTRRRFTQSIISLISYMVAAGEQPILDFVKRSTEEQQRLFALGRVNNNGIWIITDKDKVVTYKDGIINISGHQTGLSADIYLWNFEKNEVDWSWQKDKAEKWHRIWESKYGGNPMIEWDICHFEML